MAEDYILTQEGYDKIVAEHEELVSVRRKEVSERLKEAISYGDLSENAEYDAAKNEQAELEERILVLEDMMRKAKVVTEADLKKGTVNVGLTVVIQEVGSKDKQEYTIVGSTEADPFKHKISNESAVGAGLIGHKVGETVEITVPSGAVMKYKIIEIKR